jgi:hypothetical protein
MMQFLAQNIIVLIFSVITPPIMMYTHKLMMALANRWKLENAAEYDSQVSALVETAIKGIEQKAIAVTSDLLKSESGKKKLEEAIAWVNNELAQRNLPPVPPAQLAMKVEAKLWDEVDK